MSLYLRIFMTKTGPITVMQCDGDGLDFRYWIFKKIIFKFQSTFLAKKREENGASDH